MAVKLPFRYDYKYMMPKKITIKSENTFWVDVFDTVNDLIARCNLKNGSTIPTISAPKTVATKNAPLSAADYDENITKLETACNAIIAASGTQHVNPANTMSLHKRLELDRPLFVYERDTNCSTLQVFINSIDELYKLV